MSPCRQMSKLVAAEGPGHCQEPRLKIERELQRAPPVRTPVRARIWVRCPMLRSRRKGRTLKAKYGSSPERYHELCNSLSDQRDWSEEQRTRRKKKRAEEGEHCQIKERQPGETCPPFLAVSKYSLLRTEYSILCTCFSETPIKVAPHAALAWLALLGQVVLP